jgi:hypothetical protein
MINFNGDNLVVPGNLQVGGNITPARNRSAMEQENNAVYSLRVESAVIATTGQPLAASGSGSDLGLYVGAHGTGNPYLSSGDVKNATTTRKARFTIELPVEYTAGQTVTLRFAGGMLTTVASGSCTLDCEAFKVGRDTLVSGSDLCTTAAQSINSLTFANKEFTITEVGLAPGDRLDVLITIVCVDVATATAVKPAVAAIDLLCDIKG